jgi:sec-independent protein translocase protein TatC
LLAPEIRSIGEVGRHASRILGRRIRIRLFWVLLTFGSGAGATWYYREAVFNLLLAPAGGNLSPFEGNLPIFTSPTAMMGATIQLAIRGGIIAALPVLVVSVYTLFSSLIAPQQRRFLVIFMPATVVSFLLGSGFAYWVLLPTGLKFLLNFGAGVAVPVIVLSEYLDLLTAMIFWLGVVFELPIAMFLLAKMRIVSYLRLRGFRKYVPVAAFILSAIITPTFDVFNQTLLAVPIIVLYEVGLFLSWVAWTEEGDYMFVKKIGAGLAWVRRKVRAGLAWVLRRIRIIAGFPVVKIRWAYRKVLRKE